MGIQDEKNVNIFEKLIEANLFLVPPKIFMYISLRDIHSLILSSKIMNKIIKESPYWKLVIQNLLQDFPDFHTLSIQLGWF